MSDTRDAFIGYDSSDSNPQKVGISFGAPGSLSAYIVNVGDGKNWKERLTAAAKTFTVPVVIQEGAYLKLGGGTPFFASSYYASKSKETGSRHTTAKISRPWFLI
jgi:hypothetical protein